MNVLDLADESTCPKQFSFSFEYPKLTVTGVRFLSYEGLRAYMITGSKHSEYLQGNIAYANQNYRSDYVYVPVLKEVLESTLRLEIAKNPFLRLKYGPNTEVVWGKMGITPAQQEWVEIVRGVLAK